MLIRKCLNICLVVYKHTYVYTPTLIVCICSCQIYTVFYKSSKPSGYKNRGLVQETSELASDCHLPVSNQDQLGLEALELDIPPFARLLPESEPPLYVIEGHLVLDTMILACWLL